MTRAVRDINRKIQKDLISKYKEKNERMGWGLIFLWIIFSIIIGMAFTLMFFDWTVGWK